MFAFDIDEVVYYMDDNKVHSAAVLSRIYVDNKHETVSNKEQEEAFQKFGNSRLLYATVHGVYDGGKVFGSREELLASL